MFTATTTTKKHLFTVIPAKTKQCHFVRICGNVTEKFANFMPNVVIFCDADEQKQKKTKK